jgi:Fe-S-cluster containining protein
LCCTLLVEVDLEDARREPQIAEKGSPIYQPPELSTSGERELIGYPLNAEENGYTCAFLDRQTNFCTIHETRPLHRRRSGVRGQGHERGLGQEPLVLRRLLLGGWQTCPQRQGPGR